MNGGSPPDVLVTLTIPLSEAQVVPVIAVEIVNESFATTYTVSLYAQPVWSVTYMVYSPVDKLGNNCIGWFVVTVSVLESGLIIV